MNEIPFSLFLLLSKSAFQTSKQKNLKELPSSGSNVHNYVLWTPSRSVIWVAADYAEGEDEGEEY